MGGLIPLAPYILLNSILSALWVSMGVTLFALLAFGYIKRHFTGFGPLRGGFLTVLTGELAAAAAFILARMSRV
jgi:vacuolar iron transporter family protein